MAEKVRYCKQPEAVTYMPLPEGGADVWLTKNAVQIAGGEDAGAWEADEVYLRTTMSRADIEENFDALFGRDELLTDSQSDVETRIADLEEAMNLILTGATE